MMILFSLLWIALILPSREIATINSALLSFGGADALFRPNQWIETAYHLSVTAAPFMITMSLAGSWSFYFIRSYWGAIVFCMLPLLSFVPFIANVILHLF